MCPLDCGCRSARPRLSESFVDARNPLVGASMIDDRLPILSEQSRRAVQCTFCFCPDRSAEWAFVPTRPANRPDDVAVPPYVGPDYWSARQRIAVMMLNPGHAAAEHKMMRRDLGRKLRDGEIDYTSYNEQLAELLPKWGFGGVVRWLNAVGLNANEVAFLNMALCAVDNDKYFPELFRTCFERNTRNLLETLKPHVVLLCGKKQLEPYVSAIERLGTRTILTWHYRPMNTKRGQAEIQRVRATLSSC